MTIYSYLESIKNKIITFDFLKIFGLLEEKKNSQAKFTTINAHESADSENAPISAQMQKENHQKIVFDEDF